MTKSLRRYLTVVMVLLAFGGAKALAQERNLSPAQLLEKVMVDGEAAPYQGSQVSVTWNQGGSQATIAKVYHLPPRTRWEFLGQPHGQGTVVIGDGYHSWEIADGGKLVILYPSGEGVEPGFKPEFQLMLCNYVLRDGGTGAVAGITTRIIDLVPHYPSNPRYRIWVDPRTGLILRNERYRPDGDLVYMSLFTELKYTMPPEHLFWPKVAKDAVIRRADNLPETVPFIEVEEHVGFSPWLPVTLPPGYTFLRARVLSGRVRVAQLEFSDGLNYLSLFEYPAGRIARPRGATEVQFGGKKGYITANANGWALSWADERMAFVLIGGLPTEELMNLAATVSPQEYYTGGNYVFTQSVNCLKCRSSHRAD